MLGEDSSDKGRTAVELETMIVGTLRCRGETGDPAIPVILRAERDGDSVACGEGGNSAVCPLSECFFNRLRNAAWKAACGRREPSGVHGAAIHGMSSKARSARISRASRDSWTSRSR